MGTQVMSAVHTWFGALTVNRRCTRSAAATVAPSRIVVRWCRRRSPCTARRCALTAPRACTRCGCRRSRPDSADQRRCAAPRKSCARHGDGPEWSRSTPHRRAHASTVPPTPGVVALARHTSTFSSGLAPRNGEVIVSGWWLVMCLGASGSSHSRWTGWMATRCPCAAHGCQPDGNGGRFARRNSTGRFPGRTGHVRRRTPGPGVGRGAGSAGACWERGGARSGSQAAENDIDDWAAANVARGEYLAAQEVQLIVFAQDRHPVVVGNEGASQVQAEQALLHGDAHHRAQWGQDEHDCRDVGDEVHRQQNTATVNCHHESPSKANAVHPAANRTAVVPISRV